MKKFLKKRWLIVLIVIIIIGFFAYKQLTAEGGKKNNSYKIKRQTLKEFLSLSGDIDAEEKATAKFQTSGLLTWVGVKEGDYVKKYQGIASLDKRELEKNLKKYLNTFLHSRWDLDQQRADYKDKAITDAMQRILDQAQFDLNNSIIDVEIKDIALKFAYLSSPIEGVVTRVGTPYAGVNITATNAEFDIVNPKTIYFSANAEQSEVVQLKKGMRADIILDPYPDKKLTGNIYFIGFIPKTGETGVVYEVKLKLNDNNNNYKYKIGMTGDVEFLLREKKDVLAVPSTYIKSQNGKKYIWQKKNGKKVKTFINIGDEIDSDTEIISGLQEGDIIYD